MASGATGELGASAVSLGLLGRDGAALSILAAEGLSAPARVQLGATVPIDAWAPVQAVMATRRPLLWPSLAERDRQYPELRAYPSDAQSWAVLPLVVHRVVIGVLALGWPDERPFGEVETGLLQVVAYQCAVALDRARIDAVRRAERETLELLSEGTRVLVSALDPQRVPGALVQLAVPRLAPYCAVFVAERDRLRRVSIAVDGDEQLAASLRGELAMSVGDPAPPAVAFRTGVPQIGLVDEPLLRRDYSPEQADRLLRRMAGWTSIVVPIQVVGKPIGAMALASPAWTTGPPERVRFAAEGLASRAGVALTNARRFADERRTAAMLMEAFLPTEVPDVPGYDIAARYLPAGSRVAGDWFDVLTLPSGAVLIGIGDAGGHGIPAAALMGQLRNCARGLAMTGQSPVAVLEALQLVTAANGPDSFATALYATLDPAAHTVRWSAAGHLPPLRFRPGFAAFATTAGSPPLGTPSPPLSELAERWQPGEGVVLVTDGVVERRGASLDEGLAALESVVARHSSAGAAGLTERIVEQLCGDPEDDCCVVVVKRT